MPLDRHEHEPTERTAGAEDASRAETGMVKERETKEDGRYIIFYSFGAEEDD
jgi:hypothetical protein